MTHPLVFFVGVPFANADELAETFPYKQSQALVIILNEANTWLGEAMDRFGNSKVKGLAAHCKWLVAVEAYVDLLWEAINDDDEIDVLTCRLSADDALYDDLDSLINDCPSDDEITSTVQNRAMAEVLVSLTGFWIDNIRRLLVSLLSQISNDGETLSVLGRQKILAQIKR